MTKEYVFNNCETCGKKPTRFAKGAPSKCPAESVIPVLNVLTNDGLKGLYNVLVHVQTTNTTYYIDDKHRIIIVWAGPVEANDYDYENNPLGLRSQTVYDFANNRAIYYSATGSYRLITLGV